MPMPRKHPLPKTGDAHNEWTVIYGPVKGKIYCLCNCGECCWVKEGDVYSGRSKRCRDCGNCQPRPNARRKHLPDVPNELYNRLRLRVHNAIARCTEPLHHKYKDYGARGIRVEFTSAEEFIEHLLTLPGHDNQELYLDREDNNGNYAAGNLRFVTPSESRYNQRRCK